MDYTQNAVEVVENAIKERIEEEKVSIKKELAEKCKELSVMDEQNQKAQIPLEDILAYLEEK